MIDVCITVAIHFCLRQKFVFRREMSVIETLPLLVAFWVIQHFHQHFVSSLFLNNNLKLK